MTITVMMMSKTMMMIFHDNHKSTLDAQVARVMMVMSKDDDSDYDGDYDCDDGNDDDRNAQLARV